MAHLRKDAEAIRDEQGNCGDWLSALLASSLIGGCTVGPKYQRPAIQPPAAYHDLGESSQVPPMAASYADLPWWQVFQDPQLQELIRTALKQNYDLQIATERINAARDQVTITRSSLFPQVAGNANFKGGQELTAQSKFNFLSLSADAAFQLDLFGKLRNATKASRAQLLATEEAQRTVILTLVSDVASAYFDLVAARPPIANHEGHSGNAGRLRQIDFAPPESRRGHKA